MAKKNPPKIKLCLSCGKNPQPEDDTSCQECREWQRVNNSERGKVAYHARVAAGLCGKCGVPLVNTDKKHCEDCLAARRELTREMEEEKVCLNCRGDVAEGCKYCEACLVKMRPKNNDRNLRRKLEVFEYYGGCICANCGITNHVVLTIDHIDGNGSQHRKQVGGGGERMYRWLKNNGYPSGYQVLCFNCNIAKWRLGQCPVYVYGQPVSSPCCSQPCAVVAESAKILSVPSPRPENPSSTENVPS